MVVSELVQESPVTSIAGDEALTELEAKYAELKEQLHYTKGENDLLNQNLEEKEQKLSVLKDIMDQDKALLEEVSCENKILKECLEEKKQELGILNNVITQDAIAQGLGCYSPIRLLVDCSWQKCLHYICMVKQVYVHVATLRVYSVARYSLMHACS